MIGEQRKVKGSDRNDQAEIIVQEVSWSDHNDHTEIKLQEVSWSIGPEKKKKENEKGRNEQTFSSSDG